MSQETLELSQFLTTEDQLWELFVNADSWLRGQYLCQEVLASPTSNDSERQIAQSLLNGIWPTQWGSAKCHWPARDETVYLKRWSPVMAFGVATKIADDRLLTVELQAVTETDTSNVDMTQFEQALANLQPEQIEKIKQNLAA